MKTESRYFTERRKSKDLQDTRVDTRAQLRTETYAKFFVDEGYIFKIFF